MVAGAHYIDLADARDFVTNITSLADDAEKSQLYVISGASTVPTLSAAVIDAYRDPFDQIDYLQYGISPGQKTPRGLATAQAVLSYIGQPITGTNGGYGWQQLYLQHYPSIRSRLMGLCDVPDYDLFKTRYSMTKMTFSAGMESKSLHLAIWLSSWLVRLKIIRNLSNYANFLHRLSHRFDPLGSQDGGMHLTIRGKDLEGQPLERTWYIEAFEGDGPMIPCISAIILTHKILKKELDQPTAMPCIGLITLTEYLDALTKEKVNHRISLE